MKTSVTRDFLPQNEKSKFLFQWTFIRLIFPSVGKLKITWIVMSHQDQGCHRDCRRLQECQQFQARREIRTDRRRRRGHQPDREGAWRREKGCCRQIKYFQNSTANLDLGLSVSGLTTVHQVLGGATGPFWSKPGQTERTKVYLWAWWSIRPLIDSQVNI